MKIQNKILILAASLALGVQTSQWALGQTAEAPETSGALKEDAAANVCSAEAFEHAKGAHYDPVEAHNFGLKIQSMVRNRDLEGLFSLVEGELRFGPRKKFIEGKSFNEIFHEGWREAVLFKKPDCDPVGWRGFMIGVGWVWYDYLENHWQIITINGGYEESKAPDLAEGWEVNGVLLSPRCVPSLWHYGTPYEDFASRFQIDDLEDFASNPGKYIGREIDSFEPIPLERLWAVPEDERTISILKFPDSCGREGEKLEVREAVVHLEVNEYSSESELEPYYTQKWDYEIFSKISLDQCRALAPNLDGICKGAYLVRTSFYDGGSMGPHQGYNIYGVFELPDARQMIVPLKNFQTKNMALNFLDGAE